MPPPRETLLDRLTAAGVPVTAVGKVSDLFAGRGIGSSHPTTSDADGLDALEAMLDAGSRGLLFVNLVDFDTLYGHRNDVARLRRQPRAVRRPARRGPRPPRPPTTCS